MEAPQQLTSFRNSLKKASSKEELAAATRGLLKAFPNRYKPLREHLESGNKDISERLRFLRATVEGDFLDIGSYDGFFVLELEKEAHKAAGVDMMDEAINFSLLEQKKYPNSHASFYKAYAEDIPLEDNSFDTTIQSHTLEYVFDPAVAISEAARITRTGGKLIVIVPVSLGNDPTHIRVVEPAWLEDELRKYGNLNQQQTVGDGVAYICRIDKSKEIFRS